MCLQAVHGACCTMGQPKYQGSAMTGVFPVPTCSDGPCSGTGFDYLAMGSSVKESPDPRACCVSAGWPEPVLT